MDNNIIVIDDERDFLDSVKRGLITSGINNVHVEENPRKVASIFNDGAEFDVALIDITMPEMDGVELLEVIKNTNPSTECIMVTAVDEARTAVNCLKKGAYDFPLLSPSRKKTWWPLLYVLWRGRGLLTFWISQKARLCLN
jgi:two-component system response regulator AtoC